MLLNLGCGGHYHADWINVDLAREPLPFADGSCAAVYHSHALEHIPPAQAPSFLAECSRVLAAGGVVRVVVPNLEEIAREYLRQLESEAFRMSYSYPFARRRESYRPSAGGL